MLTIISLLTFLFLPNFVSLVPRVEAAAGAVNITSLGTPISENFDTLISSGSATWVNDSTIPGWYHARTGTGTTIVANNGGNNAGNLYSYGTGTNTDRALGSVGSGNVTAGNFHWGVRLANETGSTITSLTVSYTGEQWRNGGSPATAQTADFSYRIGTGLGNILTDFTTGGVAVPELSFTSPVPGGTAGALDGNAAANRAAITHTITGLSLAPGQEILLRWSDIDHPSADHGLSIDDFTITANGGGDATLSINDVSVTEGDSGTVNATFTVSVSTGAHSGVTFDIATADGVGPNAATLADNDYVMNSLTGQTIAAGDQTYTFDVIVNGDTIIEPNETFFVNVTNVVGATVSDGQGVGTITNDDAPTVATNVIINEIDSDTPGTDAAEFVELYDGGTGNTSLDGLVVVFYNGSNDLSYRAMDLDGFTTNANGYFTLGNAAVPGVDLIFPGNTLQNGQDAVALYAGDASNFPNGTPVTTINLVDAIVYDNGQADDAGLLVLLNAGEPQVNESGGGDGVNHSLQRCPNGAGGKRNTSTYIARTPTPDAENNCPLPPVVKTIPEIQGDGATSPFAGLAVTTSGIVTAIKQEFSGGVYNVVGFFLQTTDAEAAVEGDPATSQGIFVFLGSPPPVAVGDSITVTGTATEFFNLTEISATASGITVHSSGNPLPAPVALTTSLLNPAGPLDQLERFEGMRMHAASLVSVAPTNQFGEIFTVIDGVARPLREPGIESGLPIPPDPTSLMIDPNIPIWDLNPERITIDSDGLAGSAVINVTSNVTLTGVTGPLDFTFSNYKVLPEMPPATSANMAAVPVPAPDCDEFTVAGFNIENFNSGKTDQLQKAALAIRTVMRYPDVIGHVEIANLASLQALASQVNNDAVAAGDPNPMYEARLIPFIGTQHVGFLVKTSRVQIDSVTQERASDTFINPNTGLPETLHDRPPLVLHATVDPAGINPRPIIVVVNHLRSFIDIELVAGDGPRVRAKRTKQAESVAGLLQELQINNPTTPVISVGDYNAYQFNDGYTDPISVIKGMPTPDDQIVVDESPDLVEPDFINLTDELPAQERYSFIFEGTPQALDHVIVNTLARSYLTRYHIARNNADFPESAPFAGNTSRPEANSDHDMPVAYFRFPPAIANVSVTPSVLGPPNHKMVDVVVNYTTSSNCGLISCVLSVTSNEPVNGTGDGDAAPDWIVVDAHNVKLRQERAGTGNDRIYTITITCTDPSGNVATKTVTVTVPKGN